MRALLMSFVAGLVLAACAPGVSATGTSTAGASARSDYTLYLVRHAEKVADDSHDPDLTAAGRERAAELAESLQQKGIRTIWSSDYQRTRKTAAPLAKQLGLKVRTYDPGEPAALKIQLEKRHESALIVGHSNTIPQLARILCNCKVADMEETEYDRLIVIRVHDSKAELQTLRQ